MIRAQQYIASLLLIWLFLGCQKKASSNYELINFIPQNTAVVVKTSEIKTLKSNLNNNDLIQKLSKTSFKKHLEDQLAHLAYLNTDGELLICFTELGKENFEYTLITKYQEALFEGIDAEDITTENIDYQNNTIIKTTANKQESYQLVIDGFFIISSSKLLIENTIRHYQLGSTFTEKDFRKVYETANSKKSFTLYINHNNADRLYSLLFPNNGFKNIPHFANWASMDADISQDKITINGITTAKDSPPTIIDLFRNTLPQQNHIAGIAPGNSDGIYAFTYDDFAQLKQNIDDYNRAKGNEFTAVKDSIFHEIDEIGVIYKNESKAISMHSKDVDAVLGFLVGDRSVNKEYRNTPIYAFGQGNIFANTFGPLLPKATVSSYIILDDFFVFSEDVGLLQDIIANYRNNTTLGKSSSYPDYFEELSEESSILLIGKLSGFKSVIANAVNEKYQKEIKELPLKDHALAVLQFTYDTNFAHINGLIKKKKTAATTNSVAQILNVTLDADVATRPQLVMNHRNKEKEIIVQDVNNYLYLITNKGKVLWKKQLEGRILGNMQQIDLYGNGRLQLAFVTGNKFQVIDRNGKEVAPFPIEFKDNITQPLSVFDYDKTKNYRFIITQGNELIMLNKEGKTVIGFDFTKTASELILPPKHIRTEGKDYIVVQEKNGKLHILNRRGQSRIGVSKKISFSGNETYLYQNKFSTTDINGVLNIIDLNGKLSSANLRIKKDHYFTATSKTMVTLSANELTIKGKKVPLDFGLYSAPRIFLVNNKIYISVTDTQSQKVYLFDSNAKLLPNFPVYGTSGIDLENIDKDPQLEFVVQSEKNSVIVYEIN